MKLVATRSPRPSPFTSSPPWTVDASTIVRLSTTEKPPSPTWAASTGGEPSGRPKTTCPSTGRRLPPDRTTSARRSPFMSSASETPLKGSLSIR
jgi:hypothetical protein